MKNILLSILFICTLSFLSCFSKTSKHEERKQHLIEYLKNRSSKVFERTFQTEYLSDSIVKFKSKDVREGKSWTYEIEMPIKGKLTHSYFGTAQTKWNVHLVDLKTFSLKNKSYTVYKYYFDLQLTEDEETIIYYNEDFGILRSESAVWLNFYLLFNDSNNNLETIFFLNEQIRRYMEPFIQNGEYRQLPKSQ